MLYDRWQKVTADRGQAIAFHVPGVAGGCTFEQLARMGSLEHPPMAAVAFPQLAPDAPGLGLAGFLVKILHAWRHGGAVCPLEPDQPRPILDDPPPGTALLKTTSATTGVPRYVAFTAEQIAADANNIVATMGLRPDWPNLGVISLAHSYGFSNLVLPLLLHGIPLRLASSPLPETVRQAAARAPHITLPAVPAMWRAWHEADAIPPNIRLAISAGAPLPLPLEQDVFACCGVKIHNFYGATECGGIAYDASGQPRTDPSCAGVPMKNVRLSTNADGCLVVRGRAVGAGYWPDPAPILARRRFVTSDLAELRDGLVHLRGRATDLINMAGRKISPETIERALLDHPRVNDCLIFGAPAPDAGRGEQIIACVVAQPGVTADHLKQFLLKQLPAWQLPRDWRFVESLAPNRRGKLSRTEWRARLGFAPQ